MTEIKLTCATVITLRYGATMTFYRQPDVLQLSKEELRREAIRELMFELDHCFDGDVERLLEVMLEDVDVQHTEQEPA